MRVTVSHAAHRPARRRPSATRYLLVALALFVVGVVGHNLLSTALGVEEPFFFLLAILVAPIIAVHGLVMAAANRL